MHAAPEQRAVEDIETTTPAKREPAAEGEVAAVEVTDFRGRCTGIGEIDLHGETADRGVDVATGVLDRGDGVAAIDRGAGKRGDLGLLATSPATHWARWMRSRVPPPAIRSAPQNPQSRKTQTQKLTPEGSRLVESTSTSVTM